MDFATNLAFLEHVCKKVIYPTAPSSKYLAGKLKDFGGSEFSTFASEIENLLSEFNVRFSDFEAMKKDILLHNSPLNVATEEQLASLQLELCVCQPILSSWK